MKSKKDISNIFDAFYKNNNEPVIELVYHSEYELLISVILSAQSKDKVVNTVTKVLFRIANTPKKMVQLGEEKLKFYIRKIGLYNVKSKNIILTSNILISKYNSKIPSSRLQLESLPGVGRKTANVILNVIFKKPTMPVDTHVFRLSHRIGLSSEQNLLKLEKNLLNITPIKYKKNAHFWLVEHGKKVCKARKPLCGKCDIAKYCVFFNKN